MKLLLKGFIFVFTVVNLSEPKVIPIIYEEFEKCVEPEETAGKFDFSELEIIAESDTKVYFNGSWNFLKQVKSPWAVLFSTEKYERGVWNPGPLSKKIKDFCKSIQSQSEPWYSVTRHFEPKNCPFAAGVRSTSVAFEPQMITKVSDKMEVRHVEIIRYAVFLTTDDDRQVALERAR